MGRHGGIPVIRDDQGNEFETSEEIAECFGRFFAKKCRLDDGDFDATDIPRFPSRCSSTLCRIRFRPSTVRRLLGQLDPAKATGPDGVPARVLKECRAVLATPLAHLFSLCFEQGVHPSDWKTANVVPVHKRKSRTDMKNYRPVSLLSVMSKVMEKVINTSIMNWRRAICSPPTSSDSARAWAPRIFSHRFKPRMAHCHQWWRSSSSIGSRHRWSLR